MMRRMPASAAMPVPSREMMVLDAIVETVAVAVRLEVERKIPAVTTLNAAIVVSVDASKVSAVVTFWNDRSAQRVPPAPPPDASTPGPVRAAMQNYLQKRGL